MRMYGFTFSHILLIKQVNKNTKAAILTDRTCITKEPSMNKFLMMLISLPLVVACQGAPAAASRG